jgi:Uma2 family endonuclease
VVRVAERRGMSPDEYLAWEREQPGRHEYVGGEVFAMAGGSLRHNALCANVIEALRGSWRDRCVVLTSDQRIVARNRERYVYPDVSAVCGPVVRELGANDVLTNPTLVVEVLSSALPGDAA